MFHYFEAITNTKGDALIGYYTRVVDTATGDTISLYADESSTPIISVSGVADAAQVDSDGMASFYVASGEYHLDIYATDSTTRVKRIENVPMTSLSAEVAAAEAAQAAAEAAQEAAEAAAAAALLPLDWKTPALSGATGDGTTNDAVALQAWLDLGGYLYMPAGEYYSADNLILRKHATIEGAGYGFDARTSGYDNMPGARIRFAAGKGFTIQGQTTLTDVATVLADTTAAFTQEGAYNSTIRNLALIGANTGATVAGCYIRTLCHLENVYVVQFTGKGFDISGSADMADGNSEYGNVSLSSLRDCVALSNGSHGIHVRGRDANTCLIENLNSNSNGGWGILDESLLGNTYDKPHLSGNTSGSIKAVGSVSINKFIGPYIEGDIHAASQIGGNSVIVGNDLSSSNTPPDVPPSIYAAGLTNIQRLKFSWGWTSPGAITGAAWIQREDAAGLTLQGEGGSSDLTLRNKAGTSVASVTTGTTSWSFKGAVAMNGQDPVFTLNGASDTIGSQVLMYANGTNYYQIFVANAGTVTHSADTLVIRDKTTLTDTRLTIDTNGLSSPKKIVSTGATSGIGYGSGARGTVTQATSKATGVTSNTVVTDITLNNAALAASTTVSFVFTNSAIAANDVLILSHVTTGTFGSYTLNAHGFGAGSCTVDVRNVSLGSLSEAIVIRAVLVKGG